MRVTLSPGERVIVEATLALANRKPILKLFPLKRFISPRLQPHVEVASLFTMTVRDLDAVKGKVTDNLIGEVIQRHHAQLKSWLHQIARYGLAAYPHVAPEVIQQLPQASALRPTLRGGRVVYQLTVDVIPGLFAYGTALILDRDHGLAQRLGQCGYCGRFNLTFEGRPKTHCNESHRLAYDRKMAAERMRSWRRRNRRKRGDKR